MPKNQSGYSQGERWHLLYEYFITHSGKNRPITTDDIISFYRSKGIEVHINTLYADIATIQTEIFGLEIEFDRQYNHGAGAYILQNPLFEINELRLIIDSIQASKFITEAQAKKLTEKVLRFVDEGTRVKLPTQTFVPDRVRNMNESAVRGAERIYEAIAKNEKIAFRVFHYGRDGKKIYSRAGKPYIVSPYATIWLNGYYYLYAFVDEENRFRHFRIDRLEGISKNPLGQREGKEKFRVSPLKQRDVKLFSIKPAKDYTVKLRFYNGLVDAVRDQFGSNITMIPDGEDGFTVSVKVRTSPEFYAWLFSFGRGVKILEPDDVINKMRQYTKNIFDMYENDGEK